MDCRTALKILDVARPGTDDLSRPELAEAVAHVESHSKCRGEFQRRQELDREIGAAMRDVPLPADLKARLLAGLAEGVAPAEPVAVAKPAVDTITSRRAWLKMVAGLSTCVAVAAIAWQFLSAGAEPIDLESFEPQVVTAFSNPGFNFGSLEPFAGENSKLPSSFEPELSGLDVDPDAKSYRPQPGVSIAVYSFRFPYRRATMTGYLLVLPIDSVKTPPAADRMGSTTSTVGRGMALQSWSSDDYVYVCIVPGGDAIETLQRLLNGRAV